MKIVRAIAACVAWYALKVAYPLFFQELGSSCKALAVLGTKYEGEQQPVGRYSSPLVFLPARRRFFRRISD